MHGPNASSNIFPDGQHTYVSNTVSSSDKELLRRMSAQIGGKPVHDALPVLVE